MKIAYSIDKESIFAYQLDEAKAMIKQAKTDGTFDDSIIQMMVACYSECEYKAELMQVSVQVCRKGLNLDYYVNMKIWGFSKCFDVGFYLSDFYEYTGDNAADTLSRAYRRIYTCAD